MSLQTPNNGSNTAPLLLAAEIKCEAGLFTFSADSWPSRHLYTLANWGPEALFPQLLGPHIPLHSGAHIFDSFPPFPSEIHTHTNIIFSPFDVYFNRSHQFTMLVRESVFSWLAISKKADLWRHNSKLSDLFYSVPGCPGCTSPEYLILGWLSLPSLLILPPSLTLPHIFVPFRFWFSLLLAQEQEIQFGFLVFFTFFDWVSYDRIFCLKFPFIGLLTLLVIFRALKDKRSVLELRKG